MKKLILKMSVFGIFVIGSQSAKAQNLLWSITPNHYSTQSGSFDVLPQPTIDPYGNPITVAYPESYYHGEIAQYATNMITKPSGEIEFFIVDGFIYDKNGYAIDKLLTDEAPNNIAKGASEI